MKKTGVSFCGLLLVMAANCAGTAFASDQALLSVESRDKIDFVVKALKDGYYTSVDEQAIVENMLSGMLGKMDPHSCYLAKDEMHDFESETSGQFGGIGVEIVPDKGMILVVTPIDDTPAARAGIKAGDKIVQIDDTLVHDISSKKAVELMRGEPGTKVRLVVISPKDGGGPVVKELTREMIKIKSVRYRMLEPGYGYVRVTFFQANTGKELRKAIAALAEQAKAGGTIDLARDNAKSDAKKREQAKTDDHVLLDSTSQTPAEAGALYETMGQAAKTAGSNHQKDGSDDAGDSFALFKRIGSKVRELIGGKAGDKAGNRSVRSTNNSSAGQARGSDVSSQAELGIEQLNTTPHAGHHGLRGLILDLRNNPGGLLDSGIQVADAFLDAAKLGENRRIVYTKGRASESRFVVHATAGDLLGGKPLVVLINEGSASAAEIVAGALQDHHRAVVVGKRSFGKGSVQSLIPLSDGSGIKITTAVYYTPGGTSLQAQGVMPDVEVEDIEIDPKAVSKSALKITEASLADHIEVNKKRPHAADERTAVRANVGAQKEDVKMTDTDKASVKVGNSLRDPEPVGEELLYKDYSLYEALQILKAGSAFACNQAATEAALARERVNEAAAKLANEQAVSKLQRSGQSGQLEQALPASQLPLSPRDVHITPSVPGNLLMPAPMVSPELTLPAAQVLEDEHEQERPMGKNLQTLVPEGENLERATNASVKDDS